MGNLCRNPEHHKEPTPLDERHIQYFLRTAGMTDLTSFYKNLEGVPTLIKNVERNEDGKYALKISSIVNINHDSIRMRL